MSNWLKSFENANMFTVMENKLKAPKLRNEENEKMLLKEVTKLKEKIMLNYDEYTRYIDNYKQEKVALKKNFDIEKSVSMLDEKYFLWKNRYCYRVNVYSFNYSFAIYEKYTYKYFEEKEEAIDYLNRTFNDKRDELYKIYIDENNLKIIEKMIL